MGKLISLSSLGELKDDRFSHANWDDYENIAKEGTIPGSTPPSTIAVETHVPGSTHTNDDHSDDSNDNITIGPGDQKLTLSWKNPFDAPMTASPEIYIYQSTNGTDFNLLDTISPA